MGGRLINGILISSGTVCRQTVSQLLGRRGRCAENEDLDGKQELKERKISEELVDQIDDVLAKTLSSHLVEISRRYFHDLD